MTTFLAYITAIDGRVFAGLILLFAAACMFAADRIARVRQPVPVVRTRAVSSNRKAGRR